MILGLDISTSITGYTILDNDGNIVLCDHIDLRKEKNFFKKADMIEEKLNYLSYRFHISKIYVEQSLQSFRSGFSSAQTLSLLSKINGIVCWQCYKTFGLQPEYLAATSARKLCGIKVPKGQKAKDVTLQFVVDNVPSFVIEYTRYGNPKAGYADRSDSYVIAKAGLIRESKET
jgi:Holliday junction resolvasome RuvABC endonuclease subunit